MEDKNNPDNTLMNSEGTVLRKNSTVPGLKEHLQSFYGCPIEEIGEIGSEEIDTGEPVGEEIW